MLPTAAALSVSLDPLPPTPTQAKLIFSFGDLSSAASRPPGRRAQVSELNVLRMTCHHPTEEPWLDKDCVSVPVREASVRSLRVLGR